MRKIQLANGAYYHIFNRGVDKRDIFVDKKDYERFHLSLILMNDEKNGLMFQWKNYKAAHPRMILDEFLRLSLKERKKMVNVVAYCLNPNHYHLILKQTRSRGIEKFMHRLSTGYTMFFNERYHRNGSLFQGSFKATHIDSNVLLLHLAVYVNCNCEIHGIARAELYDWCSFPDYLKKRRSNILSKNIISDQFKNTQSFKDFSKSYIKHFKERKADQKIFLE